MLFLKGSAICGSSMGYSIVHLTAGVSPICKSIEMPRSLTSVTLYTPRSATWYTEALVLKLSLVAFPQLHSDLSVLNGTSLMDLKEPFAFLLILAFRIHAKLQGDSVGNSVMSPKTRLRLSIVVAFKPEGIPLHDAEERVYAYAALRNGSSNNMRDWCWY
jgi:hypothetical protein